MNLGPIWDFCGGQGLYSILIDLKEDSSAYHEILEMGLKEGLLQKVVKEICALWAGSKEGRGMRFSSVERKSWAPLVLTLTNFRVIDPYAPVSTFDNDLCSHQQHSQPLEKLETLKPSQSSLEDPAQTIRVSTD
ncbi:hypothetical protein AAC387_Pa08g1583 [Persea americana]